MSAIGSVPHRGATCFLVLLTWVGVVKCVIKDRENAFVGYSEKTVPRSKPSVEMTCADENEFCQDWASNGECSSCNKCSMLALAPLPPGAAEFLVMSTKFGDITIRLRPDLAPKTVEQIKKGLRPGMDCGTACRFYRAEAVPPEGKTDNYGGPGPPYALLQGNLPPVPGGWKPVAKEQAPVVQRGMACLIQTGPDFFIAVGPHKEWAHAFTVWGQVDDMDAVDAIVDQPVREELWGQTHVTALVEKVLYRPSLVLEQSE